MKILTTIKKYKELFYMLGIILSSIVGTFLGDGILWKSQENEREKAKLELAKFESAKEIRIQIDNLYQNIFSLNNDFIKRSKKEKLTHADTLQYKRRLIYFLENYQSFEEKLSKIEEREKRSVFIPAPITEIIERPAKPEFVMFRKVDSPSILYQEIFFTTWIFVVIVIIYSSIIILVINYIYRRRIRKMKT